VDEAQTKTGIARLACAWAERADGGKKKIKQAARVTHRRKQKRIRRAAHQNSQRDGVANGQAADAWRRKAL